MAKDNNTCCPTSDRNVGKHQTANPEQKLSISGIRIDSTTAQVTSSTNPGLHVTVKVLHPSMLLAE